MTKLGKAEADDIIHALSKAEIQSSDCSDAVRGRIGTRMEMRLDGRKITVLRDTGDCTAWSIHVQRKLDRDGVEIVHIKDFPFFQRFRLKLTIDRIFTAYAELRWAREVAGRKESGKSAVSVLFQGREDAVAE